MLSADGLDQESGVSSRIGKLQARLISIEVKPLRFQGRQMVALYMKDRTSKLLNRIENWNRQQERLKARQTEGYTATLSHEMRTPLLNVIYFIEKVILILNNAASL